MLWRGSAADVCLKKYRTTILHADEKRDFNDGDQMSECNEGLHDDWEEVT